MRHLPRHTNFPLLLFSLRYAAPSDLRATIFLISGMQSPLSFGGFACLTRHVERLSGALSEVRGFCSVLRFSSFPLLNTGLHSSNVFLIFDVEKLGTGSSRSMPTAACPVPDGECRALVSAAACCIGEEPFPVRFSNYHKPPSGILLMTNQIAVTLAGR